MSLQNLLGISLDTIVPDKGTGLICFERARPGLHALGCPRTGINDA